MWPAMTVTLLMIPLAAPESGQLLLDAVREALRSSDGAIALELIVEGREPREAARGALDVAAALWWEDGDLAGSATVTLGAVHWCLRTAEKSDDADIAQMLRTAAMALAYNLAANAWPGWAETGGDFGPTVLGIGLDMARLNLRLATELGKGPIGEASGHWIVGAQLLAADRYEEAASEFGAAKAGYAEGGDDAAEAMAAGYVALTALLAGVEGGEAAVEHAVADLRALPGEDAPFYADQIVKARELLLAR